MFNNLVDQLTTLQELRGYELLDRLYPAEDEWSGPVRETISLRIGDDTEPAKLLDLLRTQITQPEKPEDGEFARVMSLHKSKGLTSRVVVVVGCIEGLCPVRDSDLTPDEQRCSLQEQRRLFYVAVTRCREILVLSSVVALEKRIAYKIGACVTGGGAVGQTVTSQFIAELGPAAPGPVAGTNWVDNGFEWE